MSNEINRRRTADHKALLPAKQMIRINGIPLAYREAGEGSPVFLLHGMNGESGSWRHQLHGLSDRYRVIAWDAPGYGASGSVGSSIESLSEAAFSLIKELGAENPVLVGHSMGGVVAGQMAIERPDSLRALVLSCSHWGYGRPVGEELMPRYSKRIDEIRSMSIEEFAQLRASRMVDEDADPEVVAFLAEMSKAVTAEALEKVGRANQETDTRPGLSKLDLPLYLLYAEKDRVIKKERTKEFIQALPAARVMLLAGVGHAPYVEDAANYNRTVRSILEEVWPDKPAGNAS